MPSLFKRTVALPRGAVAYGSATVASERFAHRLDDDALLALGEALDRRDQATSALALASARLSGGLDLLEHHESLTGVRFAEVWAYVGRSANEVREAISSLPPVPDSPTTIPLVPGRDGQQEPVCSSRGFVQPMTPRARLRLRLLHAHMVRAQSQERSSRQVVERADAVVSSLRLPRSAWARQLAAARVGFDEAVLRRARRAHVARSEALLRKREATRELWKEADEATRQERMAEVRQVSRMREDAMPPSPFWSYETDRDGLVTPTPEAVAWKEENERRKAVWRSADDQRQEDWNEIDRQIDAQRAPQQAGWHEEDRRAAHEWEAEMVRQRSRHHRFRVPPRFACSTDVVRKVVVERERRREEQLGEQEAEQGALIGERASLQQEGGDDERQVGLQERIAAARRASGATRSRPDEGEFTPADEQVIAPFQDDAGQFFRCECCEDQVLELGEVRALGPDAPAVYVCERCWDYAHAEDKSFWAWYEAHDPD